MQDRAAATIQRIVQAAGEMIDRDGYAGASTLEIQKLARVSPGGFYHHFPNKKALGDAVLARQTTFFSEVAGEPPPGLWLQFLVDVSFAYSEGIRKDPVLRAAVRLSTEPGPYQQAESYEAPLGAVSRLLEAAGQAGELRAGIPPARAAQTLVGCFTGVQTVSFIVTDRQDLEEQVSLMWAMCLPGIARPDVLALLRLSPPEDRALSR
ncbi:TetR/AcrR family transcriptional regulator (plasmid) [Streptomyces globisporus]|uniref:ScbR family autoregulator-binding transcription factor n=1 Tax=Streptomyces globisporus TaxID=1908 RepID=UPI002F90BAF9|nr:TetR/AcrR family transcriptional regulator [Streptomyces globisporus]